MKKSKNSNNLMGNAKSTIGLGIGSMAGLGAIGSIGSMKGMPANNITGIASSGLAIANIGQMAKTGLDVAKMMGHKKKK